MSELALTTAPGIAVAPTALTVTNPNISFEEVQVAFDNAVRMGDTVRWWVGDLLLYADARWGEEHAQLLDGTRLSERQAQDYRYVAERVPLSVRTENLSFSHHTVVASLDPPDQKRLLTLAARDGFSVAQLREAVRDHKAFDVPPRRQRVTVMAPPGEVDAVAGIRTVSSTLIKIGSGISPEARQEIGLPDAARALDHVGKTVKRVTSLEPMVLAVAACIAAGVRQSGLPDPAVIVPAGPWDTLVAAYATVTEGGA